MPSARPWSHALQGNSIDSSVMITLAEPEPQLCPPAVAGYSADPVEFALHVVHDLDATAHRLLCLMATQAVSC